MTSQPNTKHTATRAEWLLARKALLLEEKAFTQARDALTARRRALPRYRIDKACTFAASSGPVSLAELFGSRSQLLIYHFMFGADWEQGCKSCSFWADGFDGVTTHLAQRDVSLRLCLDRAAGHAAGVSKAHGLAFYLGVQRRDRLQCRLRSLAAGLRPHALQL